MGPPNSFVRVLERIKVDTHSAQGVQRIACLPAEELEGFCVRAREEAAGQLPTFAELLRSARVAADDSFGEGRETVFQLEHGSCRAWWKLGQLLAKVERQQTAGLKRGNDSPLSQAGTTAFRAYLREIGLNKNRANECECIAAIPEPKLKNA